MRSTGSSARSCVGNDLVRGALRALAAIAVLGVAAPASAGPADPGRSRVEAQAPALAPGVWGTAPLYGKMDGSGAFSLTAPTSAISTGNAVYDGLLRQVLGGSIALQAGPPRLVKASGAMRRGTATASVRAGVAAANVPLIVRTIEGPGGTTLRTFFSLPLAPYGVVNPRGGSPGSVRIAITAFFPR
jgi:hypothetical protein